MSTMRCCHIIGQDAFGTDIGSKLKALDNGTYPAKDQVILRSQGKAWTRNTVGRSDCIDHLGNHP
jgi:hypothetical protein